MKILLSGFFTEFIPMTAFYDHFYRWFIDCLPKDKIEVKFLMCEDDYRENEKTHILDMLNPVLLDKESLKYIFDDLDYINLFVKTNQNELTDEELNKLKKISDSIFKDWKPDIVLCMGAVNSKNIWGEIFPNALCLSSENGIFSRFPFSRTIAYDPFGTCPFNFMIKYADKIKNFKISFKQNLEIEKFKRDFQKIFNKCSIVDKEMREYKKRFRRIMLLPLVGFTFNRLLQDSIFEKDRDIVEYVLKNIPDDIGLIVTRHPYSEDLDNESIEYLLNKYKNFIFLQKTNNLGDVLISIYYYKFVDAVLNVTSKTGIEAGLIYDKPIISLTKQYNNLIKDSDNVRDIENVIKKRKKINKNNILYWYLTHYITYEQSFNEKLYDIITKKLEKYQKNGIDFNFYEQEYTMKEVYKYVLEPVKQYYNYYTFSDKIKVIYNKIIEKIENRLEKIKNKIETE